MIKVKFIQFDVKISNNLDGSLSSWKPRLNNPNGCALDNGWYYLGPAGSSTTGVIVQPSGNEKVLVPITDWERVWKSRPSMGVFTLWRGLPAPEDRVHFISLAGFLTRSWDKPTAEDTRDIMAIHKDALITAKAGRRIWSGTSFTGSVSVWNVSTSGNLRLQAIETGAFVPYEFDDPVEPQDTFAIDRSKIYA